MAYKFQLGEARLSGSLIQEGTISTTGDVLPLAGSGDIALGSTTNEWADLYIRNNIKLGVNQEAQIIYHSSKVNIENAPLSVALGLDVNGHDGSSEGLHLGGTLVTATAAEFNLLDGGTAVGSSITLADSDGIIVDDAGTMKKIPASNFKTYLADNSLNVALKDNTNTLSNGVNYFADLSGAEAVSLPASPDVGDNVFVKAPSNCSSTNTLTINRQGSHTIDGETAIVLESPHAAVMLVYVVSNTWKVF